MNAEKQRQYRKFVAVIQKYGHSVIIRIPPAELESLIKIEGFQLKKEYEITISSLPAR